MGAHHNHSHVPKPAGVENPHYRRVLWWCLFLNFSLFLIELGAGFFAHSVSLLADSMDFLSDSAGYIIGLFVLRKSLKLQNYAALVQGSSMLFLGVFVFWQAIERLFTHQLPNYSVLGSVALLALVANIISAWLLYRERDAGNFQQSLWLCSRNDAINNLAMMAAAGIVFYTQTPWADVAVGVLILWLEGSAGWGIVKNSYKELRAHTEK